jgi:hypothetical protein
VNVAPLVPVLANFFDDVLNKSVSELNLKVSFASTLHGLTDSLWFDGSSRHHTEHLLLSLSQLCKLAPQFFVYF